MIFDRLKQVRDELRDARYAIADIKIALRERISATEVKFDPNQPRAPQGTPIGGRWTSAGGGSGHKAPARKPSPPPAPPKAKPPQTLGFIPRAASRTSLPLIAGAVGVQRATGTYATVVSGQSQTPFLHIPYQKPTVGSMPAPKRRAVRRPRSRATPTAGFTDRDQLDRQCSIKLELDLKACSRNSARYGRENGDQRKIFAICRATAKVRYSECIAGGGIHAIKTPLYRGHNY
ncbi:MAG: hypothetical protein RL145_180 [Pseudomonadota bacterium]|jgi:hypothetical protein